MSRDNQCQDQVPSLTSTRTGGANMRLQCFSYYETFSTGTYITSGDILINGTTTTSAVPVLLLSESSIALPRIHLLPLCCFSFVVVTPQFAFATFEFGKFGTTHGGRAFTG
ncbi:hypothetical protein BDP27DRAFT_1449108 [Rhodocollybia butyracea]|uniref:Uncharacterized protein n=1 Tax=Rhodocollybia butyracea TaxID=206335 RepID=A0A9P5U610_9AGAR|nr:hypothetical protein BDP27DRAFT_1449108 [Rhodocollybia butyracea]